MTTRLHTHNQGERGIIIILAGVMLTFIIPMIGLAIDAGTVYAVKAKAQSAVDGAALSAARSLSRGLDLGSQQGAATDTAIRWYHANIPNGWMNVANLADPTVTFPAAPPKTTIVNVAATIQAPAYFMRVAGVNSVTITVVGQANRRDVNIILVLDRSGSLYESGSCGAVQAAASQFVNSFVNGRDRLGLVTFGTDYRVDFPPAMNFATAGPPNLVTDIGQLYCYGYTNAAAAYWAAYQQLVSIGDQGALNVLLFFTDGMPNTVTFGIAPDGTDNRLPAKTLATPSTLSLAGYDNANPTPCQDSAGRTSGGSWNPGPFTGVVSFAAGIYLKDALSFPASQAVDARKIGTTEGNYGGCAFDVLFSNAATIYSGGSPSRALAGPGFVPFFDIAYLPEEDIFRNKTGTGYGGGALFATVRRYPNTYPAAYQNKIRVDDIGTGSGTLGVSDSITNAGLNSLDYAAQRARDDSISRNLNVVTYTIGLGNSPGGVDDTLLQRVANDPNATGFYNSGKPSGLYIPSLTAAQLNQAFSRIASDVLRLSR